ncbi:MULTISPECIES: TetR/AcrR family transcriptional regulator [Inquilinus]|uniref:AcrR family transcriptional regulator n=1 Tax=Inquilinus ginsengisoli TaxID=363840 RepID=A0ABU1JIU6_9PROT|nr:TetR/AcrR family transcriptional regulator [Inquilinus ginsengisoli]MDR6288523.1 AcrR family transcriptional regulator [Inquilinus ginsengisoli]
MEPDEKSRGGRPWSFDRDSAVETAMRLFWRHGYEGVSVGDLTKAIGIAPPSLYAAFGSKAGLYREALDRYEHGLGSVDVTSIGSATTLAEAVRRLLETAAAAVTHPDRERGCMVSSGMIACHPDNAALARDLAVRRDATRERIAQALRPFADAEEGRRLARHLAAVMQGISIQARDGATPAELQEIIEDVVAGVAARSFG